MTRQEAVLGITFATLGLLAILAGIGDTGLELGAAIAAARAGEEYAPAPLHFGLILGGSALWAVAGMIFTLHKAYPKR